MINRTFSTFLLLILLSLSGCDFVTTNNSYIDGEEYVNEPLSETSSKYRAHLSHSNQLIEYVRVNDIDSIYAAAASNFMRDNNRESIAALLDQIHANFGEIIEYKSNQWSFTKKNLGDVSVVYSSKIVIHEQGEVIYHFGYVDDGKLGGYHVFHVSPRIPGESIGGNAKRTIERYEDDA